MCNAWRCSNHGVRMLHVSGMSYFYFMTDCGHAQVLYNAQMIRTWSLLLRNAQRLGYIVSGRQVGNRLSIISGSASLSIHQYTCTPDGVPETIINMPLPCLL